MDAESQSTEPVSESDIFAGITTFLENSPLDGLPLDNPRFRGEQERARDLTAEELRRLHPVFDKYSLPAADAVKIMLSTIVPDADEQGNVHPSGDSAVITFTRGTQTTDYRFHLTETGLTGVKAVADEPELPELPSTLSDSEKLHARLSRTIIEIVTADPNASASHEPSSDYRTYPVSPQEMAFLQEVLGVLGGEPTPSAVTA